MIGRQCNKEDLILIAIRLAMSDPTEDVQTLPQRLRRRTVAQVYTIIVQHLDRVGRELAELRARRADQARDVREARRTQGMTF